MKLRSIHIILIVILAISIFMITSSDSVVPYSKDTLFSNMYKYEGMAVAQDLDAGKIFQDYVDKNIKKPEPLTQSDYNKAVASTKAQSITGLDGFIGGLTPGTDTKNKDPKLVEGFALQPAPFAESQVLDRYSSTPSGPQCFGKSSGYSNSLGPLCLSQEDARLLSTRGGNITGNDSTIGL